ncbi:MAG: hypothetical protein FWD40_03790 [Treponema sp.]|nr:hypothetical protein [Treponema sp.]
MNVDTSVYVSVTQGISRGQMLYRDLADNKGPLNYFISVPGFIIGGLTGIWITEFIFIFITFLFMYKTALFFTDNKKSLLTVLFTSLAMLPFYYVNAGSEIYSLPFLTISLYIFTKYYINHNSHILEIIVLGICFSCSVMIRLNMFPLWTGFCFFIIIKNIAEKKYLLLIIYIFSFITGAVIALLPFLIFININGIFNDFYYNVIYGGVTRGFRLSYLNDIVNNFFTVINRSFSFIPLCIGIIWYFIKYKNINKYYFLGFIFSYFFSILFLSFATGSSHYNLILVPFFVPVIAFLADSLLTLFSKIRHKYLVMILFFCLIFSEGIVRLSYYFMFNFSTGNNLKIAGRIIDEHTEPGDKIINLGWNGYIYPYTKLDYASKYIYQNESFDHIPGARFEFISAINNNKPKVITIFTDNDTDGLNQFRPGWHAYIYTLLDTYYTLISDEYGFKIYIRKNTG